MLATGESAVLVCGLGGRVTVVCKNRLAPQSSLEWITYAGDLVGNRAFGYQELGGFLSRSRAHRSWRWLEFVGGHWRDRAWRRVWYALL